MNDPDPPETNDSSKPGDQPEEMPLDSVGEVTVEQHEAPPPGPADKQIHRRRPLPIVPPSKDSKK